MKPARDYRQVSKESFLKFKEKNPDIKISYSDWQDIIYNFNFAFRDHILETGEKGKLPRGFGEFAVKKKKLRKFVEFDGKEMIKLPVDWKKTREAGKKIYHLNKHTDGYRFAYKWFIASARFKYADIWVFKPYRDASRLITTYVKDHSYRKKYKEWDMFTKYKPTIF